MSNDPIPADAVASANKTHAVHENGATETVEMRPLSAAAKRALAEAEARRQSGELQARAAEKELGGRGGADPARYGDWEINGRAIDF